MHDELFGGAAHKRILHSCGLEVQAMRPSPWYVAIAATLMLAAPILTAYPDTSLAQEYPTRPLTIIVPYVSGGTTEISARLVGQRLEARLGKPVLIENKPGAGTVIGA